MWKPKNIGAPKVERKPYHISANFMNDVYEVSFKYDPDLIEKIKKIQGRRWDPDRCHWTLPLNAHIRKILRDMGFEDVPPHSQRHISFSLDEKFSGLRPYQLEGAKKIAVDFDLNALLGDEPGLGKTAQAIAAIYGRKSMPVLWICPAVMKVPTEREIRKWIPERTVEVLNGMPKVEKWERTADFTIVNFEIMADSGKRKGWASLLKKKGFRTVVLDECHKIKDYNTKRTKAILDVAQDIIFKIALSGTPVVNRPMEFFTTLKLIAPKIFPKFKDFGERYCDPTVTRWGTKYDGCSHGKELNEILTDTCMIRRRKADVLRDLPEKQRVILPVNINMGAYIKAVGKKPAWDLREIEVARQAAARAKMPLAVDFIETFLETGKKLVVFAFHRATLDELEKAFPGCARIDGSVTGARKQAEVDRFQTDPDCRLLIGNIQAAGTGLTLTAASDTLTLELSWTPGEHLQAEDRVHRIGQENAVTAYYLIAAGTIEEDMMRILDRKLEVLANVLDGQDCDQESMMQELFKKNPQPDPQPAMAM